MTGPIKPSEVGERKVTEIPPAVFEAFNELIAVKFTAGNAVVKQDDVVARIQAKTTESEQTIFERGWLNIEEAYEAAGWVVLYDKPGYNESYPATFTFRKTR